MFLRCCYRGTVSLSKFNGRNLITRQWTGRPIHVNSETQLKPSSDQNGTLNKEQWTGRRLHKNREIKRLNSLTDQDGTLQRAKYDSYRPNLGTISVSTKDLHQPKAWIAALKPLFDKYKAQPILPDENKSGAFQQEGDDPILDIRIADALIRAKVYANQHLIYYLATKGDWSMVSWLIRAVSSREFAQDLPILAYEPIDPQDNVSRSFETDPAIGQRLRDSLELDLDPEEVEIRGRTDVEYAIDRVAADSFNVDEAGTTKHVNHLSSDDRFRQHGALGEILTSLGRMVLEAHALPNVQTSQNIMAHVLDSLATLHQNGKIPEFTYRSGIETTLSNFAPPPIFEDLSAAVLSAMLDAQWNLFQGSGDLATFSSPAQFKIKDHEFTDHNNPSKTLPFAHEIWLELILWICLRGGWKVPGLELLRYISKVKQPGPWKASSWKQVYQATFQGDIVFPKRTISSEVINAYEEALISMIDTGSRGRPTSVLSAFDALQILQKFRQDDDLNQSSWPKLITRLLDAAEFGSTTLLPDTLIEQIIMKRAEHSQGKEITSGHKNSESIILLDRLVERQLSALIDIKAMRELLALLVDLERRGILLACTDQNLSDFHPRSTDATYSIKLSTSTIAQLIQFLSDATANSEIQHVFDVHLRPLVAHFHEDARIGPALVKYAVVSSDTQLLLYIFGDSVSDAFKRQPNLVLALALAQIEQDRWDALKLDALKVDSALMNGHSSWQMRVILALTAKTLKLQGIQDQSPNDQDEYNLFSATSLLEQCMMACIASNPISSEKQTETMMTILGILASFDSGWARFTAFFVSQIDRSAHGRHFYMNETSLQPSDYATILQGIASFRGLDAVRQVLGQWCEPLQPRYSEGSSAPRSSPTTDKYPVMITLPNSTRLSYAFRFKPDLGMVRTLLHGGYESAQLSSQVQEECTKMFKALGLDETQIREELASLQNGSDYP